MFCLSTSIFTAYGLLATGIIGYIFWGYQGKSWGCCLALQVKLSL